MSQAIVDPHYLALIKMYHAAPINSWYQPRMRLEHGHATISMDVTDRYHHSAKGVHGSVYFKMLDDAAFFAANSVDREHFVLTMNFQIELIRPFSTGEFISTGEVVHVGRTGILAKSVLHCSNGKLLATGSGRFARSAIPLNADSGYILSNEDNE